MAVVRVTITALLVGFNLAWVHRAPGTDLLLSAAYLGVTGLLGAWVLKRSPPWAMRGFNLSLLIDTVFLQFQHELLGHTLAVDVVLAADLVAACLLASFRTGVLLAVWQSIVMVAAVEGERSGLLPPAVGMVGVDRDQAMVSDALLLGLIALITASAAAVDEREVRRRRYDAEALARLAGSLRGAQRRDEVLAQLLRFVVDDLGVARAAVLLVPPGQIALLAGSGLAPLGSGAGPWAAGEGPRAGPGAATSGPSALLTMAEHQPGPTLALRLDPAVDSWLDALLPQARRLVVLPLGAVRDHPAWLLLELGPGRATLERRLLTAARQTAATAALALGRAELSEAVERAVATDALTGLANRRTLEAALARREQRWLDRGEPFAVVLLDVDHLGLINDRIGHQTGDRVLQLVAAELRAAAGPQDVAARSDGDEFCLLLPGVDLQTAAGTAERLRRELRTRTEPVAVSVSVGVAGVPENARSAAEALAVAHAALVEAKRAGRDRVLPTPRRREPTAATPSAAHPRRRA